MREILFRGYSTAERMWIYGDLSHTTDKIVHISNENCFIGVKPETVGQYTGLTDKNGKKIFEGDILKGMGSLLEVYFDAAFACVDWKIISGNFVESFSGFADEYEVIGNIHDNPELVGGDTNAN